jgi:hypothetical protein
MTTELLKQITEISNEIKNIYGNDYGEQYSNVAIKLLNQNPNNMNEYHILIEATHSLIDCDYKDKLIISLQKKIKEQEIRILKLEKDNEILNTKIDVLEKDNKLLNKKIDILMRNRYNLILWQAYKNVEYYIIQKVTGFDNNMMNNINTNLTEFKNNPSNQIYIAEINKMINKFNIPSYINNIGKLTKNRLNEAHPDPIEMDELELACEDMKKTYNGIEELYKNYQEVYDYFN